MVCMLSKDNTGEEINSPCCYTSLRANVNLGKREKKKEVHFCYAEVIWNHKCKLIGSSDKKKQQKKGLYGQRSHEFILFSPGRARIFQDVVDLAKPWGLNPKSSNALPWDGGVSQQCSHSARCWSGPSEMCVIIHWVDTNIITAALLPVGTGWALTWVCGGWMEQPWRFGASRPHTGDGLSCPNATRLSNLLLISTAAFRKQRVESRLSL